MTRSSSYCPFCQAELPPRFPGSSELVCLQCQRKVDLAPPPLPRSRARGDDRPAGFPIPVKWLFFGMGFLAGALFVGIIAAIVSGGGGSGSGTGDTVSASGMERDLIGVWEGDWFIEWFDKDFKRAPQKMGESRYEFKTNNRYSYTPPKGVDKDFGNPASGQWKVTGTEPDMLIVKTIMDTDPANPGGWKIRFLNRNSIVIDWSEGHARLTRKKS